MGVKPAGGCTVLCEQDEEISERLDIVQGRTLSTYRRGTRYNLRLRLRGSLQDRRRRICWLNRCRWCRGDLGVDSQWYA